MANERNKAKAEARRQRALRRKRVRWAVIVTVAALGLGGAIYILRPEPVASVGRAAPPFVLPDRSGREVALEDYLGKQEVVLAFYMFAQ